MARRSFWLSTLRGRDRSNPRKTRFRLSATHPGEIGYPQDLHGRFPGDKHYIPSSFSRLRLAQRLLFSSMWSLLSRSRETLAADVSLLPQALWYKGQRMGVARLLDAVANGMRPRKEQP